MSRISPIKWTTEKVDSYLEQVEKTSVVPKYSPFHKNDSELRAQDLNFGYTPEEISEKAKCDRDLFYFAETYAKVMTDKKGISLIKLRDYQKKVLHDFWRYRFNVFLASRQIGKCVSAFTKIQVHSKEKKEVPIFALHYSTKPEKGVMDYIIWSFLKFAWWVRPST